MGNSLTDSKFVITEYSKVDQNDNPKGFSPIEPTKFELVNQCLKIIPPNNTSIKHFKNKGSLDFQFKRVNNSRYFFDDGMAGFDVNIQGSEVLLTIHGSGLPILGFYKGKIVDE